MNKRDGSKLIIEMIEPLQKYLVLVCGKNPIETMESIERFLDFILKEWGATQQEIDEMTKQFTSKP